MADEAKASGMSGLCVDDKAWMEQLEKNTAFGVGILAEATSNCQLK